MIWNTILLALRAIKRNVLRSFLTVLGIVIGVAAVITMVTIGGGATFHVKQQIANMGSNLLMVTPGKRLGPGQSSNTVPFKEADVEAITREIASIAAIAPVSSQSIKAIFSNQNWTTQVTGSDSQYLKVTNRSIGSGRAYNDSEIRAGAAVCLMGETVLKKLFGGQEPLGEWIRLQNLSCEVIGLLNAKGQSTMGTDQDDIVIIPLRTFQRRIAGNQDVAMIQVSIQDGASTGKAQQEITRLMRERRHLSPSDDENFNVMDMKEIASMLTGTTTLLTALLSAVAAVSLLVGGIGIMNILPRFGDRAHSGDRDSSRHRRPGKGGARAISGGSGRALFPGWIDRHWTGSCRISLACRFPARALRLQYSYRGRRFPIFRRGGSDFRLLPGAQSRKNGSDRGAAPRIS